MTIYGLGHLYINLMVGILVTHSSTVRPGNELRSRYPHYE